MSANWKTPIERAVILAETDVIHSHDLPDKLGRPGLPPPLLEGSS